MAINRNTFPWREIKHWDQVKANVTDYTRYAKEVGGVMLWVEVGPGTAIEDTCNIGSNVVIGKSCSIGSGSTIGTFSRIGDGSTLGHWCFLLDYCTLKDSVIVGDNCVLGCQTAIGSRTVVGDQCVFGNNCSVLEDCKVGRAIGFGNDVVIHDRCTIGNYCNLGDYCWLGTEVSVAKGCRFHYAHHIGSKCKIESTPIYIHPEGGLWPVYVFDPKEKIVGIGCERHTIDWWLDGGAENVRKRHGVKSTASIYDPVLKAIKVLLEQSERN